MGALRLLHHTLHNNFTFQRIANLSTASILTTKNARDATETILLIVPSLFFMVIAVFISSLLLPKHSIVAFLLEFVVIVVPAVLNITILSGYVTNIVAITCFLLGIHLLVYVVYVCCKRLKNIRPSKRIVNPRKKDYITNCRATINMISVIAILAVDFDIFPSRYSKTHRTGFSLMDVGVGLYVFANAIVAPEVRGKKDSIKSSIKGSLILLILGILRLVLTKVTHYKVSKIEYGEHWNFFITLAFIKIFSSCILYVIKVKYIFINATLITIAHEALIQYSFKHWVFDIHERKNLLDANKEGLVSIIGYVALYLYALYFAYMIKVTGKSFRVTNIKACMCTVFTFVMTIICNYNFEVSRRLANAGYIFWVLFIGIFMLWLFYLAENGEKFLLQNKMRKFVCSPFLYEAINYNGLIFFLVGNVVTGIINLVLRTRLVQSFVAVMLLMGYMFFNCSIVFVLYSIRWKLNF
ncbi:uncharacterized protein [Euwallacea fornicatus]|uniref:uncharacterized protein isoform X2 n=1 Tax=Euwallacea fornicatus TaxID=995702 RepID=UPI00338EEE96